MSEKEADSVLKRVRAAIGGWRKEARRVGQAILDGLVKAREALAKMPP